VEQQTGIEVTLVEETNFFASHQVNAYSRIGISLVEHENVSRVIMSSSI
jgi:hypothetical protein